MNEKVNQDLGDDASLGNDLLNPFTHRLELSSTYEKIKTAIFTVLVLPFRVAAICGFLIAAWWLASIGLYGVNEQELRTKPMTGWRKETKVILCIIMRALFTAGGFHWVTVKGKQASSKEAPILAVAPHSSYVDALTVVCLGGPSVVAKGETACLPLVGSMVILSLTYLHFSLSLLHGCCTLNGHGITWHEVTKFSFRKLREIIAAVGQLTYRVGGMSIVVKGRQASRQEAPILVIAPHSTFLDAVIVYVTGFPSIIARWESGLNPWLGKLINYTQPVYVWRDDHDSRQNTIKEIIERANSELDWPQVLIFPEGTCTNRSCLITFKSGAFYPGVPIQPVCIRYPNKLDTVTWTWEGPGVLKLLWLTLTQIHSCCEIEFLPVYKPSEEEKNNPRLFANNVRKLMADALGVPVSNYTYDDCRLMKRAKQMKLPCAGKLVEMQKLRQSLGLAETNLEEGIISGGKFKSIRKSPVVSFSQFTDLLKLNSSDPAALKLFKLCEKDCTETIDFTEYLLSVLVVTKSGNLAEFLRFVFKVTDEEGEGRLNENNFCTVLHRVLSVNVDECSAMFHSIDKGRGFITFSEFKDFAIKTKKLSYIFKSNSSKSKFE